MGETWPELTDLTMRRSTTSHARPNGRGPDEALAALAEQTGGELNPMVPRRFQETLPAAGVETSTSPETR
jgi:hypothetical protein